MCRRTSPKLMKNKPTDPRTSMNPKEKIINSDRHSALTVIKKEEKIIKP